MSIKPTKLGGYIRSLRERSGLTQEDLAKKLEISQQSVAKWESGKVMPRTKVIVALEGLFKTRSGFLMQMRNNEIHGVVTEEEPEDFLNPPSSEMARADQFEQSSGFPRHMGLATDRAYEVQVKGQITGHLPGSESKWRQIVRGHTTAWLVDFADEKHVAEIVCAGNPVGMQMALMLSMPRTLWDLATLKAYLKDDRSYMVILTYPGDLEINLPRDAEEYKVKGTNDVRRTNEAMLRTFVAQAALLDIFVFLARSPGQAAELLSSTSQTDEGDEGHLHFRMS